MRGKTNIYILIVLLIIFGVITVAWALTSHHKDYAAMDIKDCKLCHESSEVPPNHGSMWMQEHRLYAEKQPNNCKDCHEQSYCLDCHTGGGIDRDLHTSTSGVDYKPKTHRTDFRELHPIKALDDPRSCYRCHDQKRFCNECHSKFNPNDLRVLSHRREWSNTKVSGAAHALFNEGTCQTCHPNSVLPKHEWSASHAREARKNLTSCQTCHPEGNVCLKCHNARSGLRVNPHPRNWGKISARMGRASNNRTCIKCH